MAITGIVSAGAVEYLSHLMGYGMVGNVLLPAIGYAAKKSADIGTRNRITNLAQSMRADSPLGLSRGIPDRTSNVPYALRAAATMPQFLRGGAIDRAKRLSHRR